jgi:GT2 family glycosyltransferase
MAEYLDDNPDYAACSPRLENEDGMILSSIRHFPNFSNIRHSRGSILGSRDDYTITADKSRKKVDALSATFMMVRRDLFEQVGRFDERYFMYVEDTDLCRKFHDLGKYAIHLGDLSVIHQWGASSSRHPIRMKLEHHRSIRKYFQKFFPDNRLSNLFLTVQLYLNFLLVSIRYLFTGR